MGGHTVIDLDVVPTHAGKTVGTIRYRDQDGSVSTTAVEPVNVVFMTNGSVTDALNLGSMTEVPDLHDSGTSFELWKALADDFPEFGKPSVFAGYMPESVWGSFTLTLREPGFLEHVVEATHEEPGNALVTFAESNWLLSTVTVVQSHLTNQPNSVKVIWGYGLFPEERGNHVNEKTEDCTSEEILTELYHHLGCTDRLREFREAATCIPCMIPFITSQLIPRVLGDRPEVVPAGSNNLMLLGQFAKAPDDVVLTVEYSVRLVLMAVHELFGAEGDVPPVSTHQYEPDMFLNVIWAALRQRPRRRRWLGFGDRFQPLAFELLDGDICVRNEPNRRW